MGRAVSTIDISDNVTTGSAIDVRGKDLLLLEMPAAFTGTVMTFLASTTSGGTFTALESDTGAAVSITVAAAKSIELDKAEFEGVQFLKPVSGSTEIADRDLVFITS